MIYHLDKKRHTVFQEITFRRELIREEQLRRDGEYVV